MGFRLFKLNPIYKPYFSRICSTTHKNSIFAHHNPTTIKSLGASVTHLQEIYDSINIIQNPPNSQTFKRWHFGHSHHGHHHGPHKGSSKKSENVFRLGLAADIGLSAGKALTGYLSGSTAIIADAAHSLSDVDMVNLRH